METLISILHIVGAVFIIGPMAILPMTAMRALRSGNGAQVRTLATSTSIFTYLAIVIVVLGFGLVSLADPKYELTFLTPWVLVSIILSAIAIVLNLVVVVPAMKRAAAAQGDASGAGTTAVKTKDTAVISAGSGIVSLLLVVVAVLMVWKP